MKLALIPPIRLLYPYTEMCEYQLALPHLLSDSTYSARYEALCEDPNKFVILDNGVAELHKFNAEDILSAAMRFRVDEVVASDVLGDAEATAESSRYFIDKAVKMGYEGRLAVVAQGNHHQALQMVAKLVEQCTMVTAVHIPRLMVSLGNEWARLDLAAQLHAIFPYIDIHLLGASSRWPQEMLEAAKHYPCIRSIDTSMPFVYAYHGVKVAEVLSVPPRHGDSSYFTRVLSADQELLARQNVERMLLWADGIA